LENLAVAALPERRHGSAVGALNVTVTRQGNEARLSDVACSLARCDKPFPEQHENAWTIALVRRGMFQYRAGATNRRHLLRPGWLLFGLPCASFECSHDHDGGDDCTSLALSERTLNDASSAAGVDVNKLLRAAPALPPLPRVAALLERTRRRAGSDVDEVGCLVAEAVVAHACGRAISAVTHHPSQASRVHEAMERIESACRDPLCLTELASDAGFSTFHFVRVFRHVTGTTPHQYLLGARLRLAARLLLDTQRSVTEIAYHVGFQDMSNFMRTFRRVVGQTPRDYRRG
jgi:AraC family transcriptional regulator